MSGTPFSQTSDAHKALPEEFSPGVSEERAAVSQTRQKQPPPANVDLSKSIGLIESIAGEKNRDQAILAMMRFIGEQLPQASVRCGIGSSQMRRFVDRKLGWLAPASDLFQQASLKWHDDTASLPTKPSIPATRKSQDRDQPVQTIRLNIDDYNSLSRCVIWIDGEGIRERDRVWLRKALPSLRAIFWQRTGGMLGQLQSALAAGGLTFRVYLTLAILVLAALMVWPVSYRVRCTTVVRPEQSRVIAAPFSGTLQTAHVTPGDSVSSGDVLISLDGRPLRLELESIEAQIGGVSKEQDVAMAKGKVAEAQQATLRIRELSRQRDLLLERLNQLDVISPIDGIVVMGDLHRSIGAPLDTGQALLEIAPLDRMTIELEIPEYEVGLVNTGTLSRVHIAGADRMTIEATIDGVLPSAELRNDENVFVARMLVENQEGKLRPGMRGEAIAYGPLRPWIWSYLRTGWEKTLWWIGY